MNSIVSDGFSKNAKDNNNPQITPHAIEFCLAIQNFNPPIKPLTK